MQSNSKLTPEQKTDLKILKKDFPGKLVQYDQTTVAYINRGNTVEFSLAVASPDEKKFRRKVGEYHALMHFDWSQTVKMARDDFYQMMMIVYGIYL